MTDEFEVEEERQNFEQIPHWVLFSVSANAVKMYCILKKYCGRDTHEAWPSRARLARDMQFKTARSIDPIIAELEAIGAVTVRRVQHGGRNQVNKYSVKWFQPNSGLVPESPADTTSSGIVQENAPLNSDVPAPVLVHSDATNSAVECNVLVYDSALELTPTNYTQEAHKEAEAPQATSAEQSPVVIADSSKAVNIQTPAAWIAKTMYDQTKGAVNYMGVHQIAKWAIEKWPEVAPADIGRTMMAIYAVDLHVPTRANVQRALDGIKTPGQPNRAMMKESTTDQRVRAALELSEMYRSQGR